MESRFQIDKLFFRGFEISHLAYLFGKDFKEANTKCCSVARLDFGTDLTSLETCSESMLSEDILF